MQLPSLHDVELAMKVEPMVKPGNRREYVVPLDTPWLAPFQSLSDTPLRFASILVALQSESHQDEHQDDPSELEERIIVYLTDVTKASDGAIEVLGTPYVGNRGTVIKYTSRDFHRGLANETLIPRIALGLAFTNHTKRIHTIGVPIQQMSTVPITLSNGTVVTVPTRGPLGPHPITSSLSYGKLVSDWVVNPLLHVQTATANVVQLQSYTGSASFAVRYHNDYVRVLEDSVNYQIGSLSEEINTLIENGGGTNIGESISNITSVLGEHGASLSSLYNSVSSLYDSVSVLNESVSILNDSVSVHELNIHVLAGSYNKTLQTVMYRMQLFEAFVRAAEPAIEMQVGGTITNFSDAFPAWPANYSTDTVNVLSNGGDFAFGDNFASYSSSIVYTMFRFLSDRTVETTVSRISNVRNTFVLQNLSYNIMRPQNTLYTEQTVYVGETANLINSTSDIFRVSFNDGTYVWPITAELPYTSLSQNTGFASTRAASISTYSFYVEDPLLTLTEVVDNALSGFSFYPVLEMGQGNFVMKQQDLYPVQFMQLGPAQLFTVNVGDKVAFVNTTSQDFDVLYGAGASITVPSKIEGKYEGVAISSLNDVTSGQIVVRPSISANAYYTSALDISYDGYGTPGFINKKILRNNGDYVVNGKTFTENAVLGTYQVTASDPVQSFFNDSPDIVYASYYDGHAKKNFTIGKRSNLITSLSGSDIAVTYDLAFAKGGFVADATFSMYTYNLQLDRTILTPLPFSGDIIVPTPTGVTEGNASAQIFTITQVGDIIGYLDNYTPTMLYFNSTSQAYTVTTKDDSETIYGGRSLLPNAGIYMTNTVNATYSIAVPLLGYDGSVTLGKDATVNGNATAAFEAYTGEVEVRATDVVIRDSNHFSSYTLALITGAGAEYTLNGNVAFINDTDWPYYIYFDGSISDGAGGTLMPVNTNRVLQAGELFITSVSTTAVTAIWIFQQGV